MYSIRNATEEDIPGILQIEREAISPPWTHGTLLSEIYREDSFFAITEHGALPLTAHEPQLSGFVILRQMGDEGELLQIAVDKAMRRRGAADALIGAVLLYAGENALKSIFLEVRKNNEAAIALYKKHGFESVRTRKDYYINPVEDATVMARDL